MENRSAVFLDRDGVINQKPADLDYVKNWGEFKFLPGVFNALRLLSANGFLIIVVTNQRCVAKGIITEDELKEIHRNMVAALKKRAVRVDAIYVCPHEISENCDCRKPKPGMILNAIRDFKDKGIRIMLEKSYMIGDDEKDILAGRAAGLQTFKVGDGFHNSSISGQTLLAAAKSILAKEIVD